MKPIVVHRLITISIATIILSLSAYFIVQIADSKKEIPYYSTIPEFSFLTQDSLPYDVENMRGKLTVVDFMFTRCHGPCPIMVDKMGELYRTFENDKNVQYLSISVDPEFDTFEILQQYATDNGVTDSRWQFVRSDTLSIINLCEKGFKLSAEDLPGSHSTKFILVDEQLFIRGYYSGIEDASIEILQSDIRELLLL